MGVRHATPRRLCGLHAAAGADADATPLVHIPTFSLPPPIECARRRTPTVKGETTLRVAPKAPLTDGQSTLR